MTDLTTTEGVGGRPRWFKRRSIWGVAAAVVVASAIVLFWFQPQKLFIDDRVDEAIPTAAGAASPGDGTSPATALDQPAPARPAEPVELLRGEFVSLDHTTAGVARVLDTGDGKRFVRLEALDTDNGPDLYVYLSANRADGKESGFDDDYVSLGRLTGNKGDQNYELPADVDLSRYATVVIWCDRFDAAFGAADLA